MDLANVPFVADQDLNDSDTDEAYSFVAPDDAGSSAGRGATAATVAAGGLMLAACKIGGGSNTNGTSSGNGTQTPLAATLKPATDAQAARFALHAKFEVTDADITALKADGYSAWLNNQMNIPAGQKGWDWLEAKGYGQINDSRFFDNYYPGDFMAWNQLLTSPDSVRKKAALALSEFFVVGLGGVDFGWRSHMIAHYWDQLNNRAFDNFRNLLEDVTLNSAMGVYLSTRGNQREDAATGRRPDENYAREVMQLFSIGLVQLNIDGTPKLDASNKPIESYTQDDVTNLARVFTGYDMDRTGMVKVPLGNETPPRMVSNNLFSKLPMTLDFTKFEWPRTTSSRSTLAVTFLGTTIPANTDGKLVLKTALDTLFNHPNVGPFFSKQMIQRLVTSNPSPAYVERVAKVFNDNGSGVRGDLRAVFRAILLDDDATSTATLTSTTYGKVREPIARFAQWGRSFGATSPSGDWKVPDMSRANDQLAQSPLRSPSVFNFFRPGYVPPNTAIASNNMVAPEFQLINETSIAGYANHMNNTIRNGISGTDVKASYAKEVALADDSTALVNRLDLILTAGQLSEDTKKIIKTAVDSIALPLTNTDAAKLTRAQLAVFLTMISPEYLVQK